MNMQEYVELKLGNGINEESWDALWRKLAFCELDSQLEEFAENDKANDPAYRNNGADLMDITTADVERIVDEFVERYGTYVQPAIDDCIRNAILAATGIDC